MAKTWHTWEHGTVQSLAVVRLRIVHDNCDFTERPLVYWGSQKFSHLMHTSANILPFFCQETFVHKFYLLYRLLHKYTVKSQLSERRLSETTGLFEDDGQSRLFSLYSIAIKLPIIRISIIRKNQFFEVIRRSRSKK